MKSEPLVESVQEPNALFDPVYLQDGRILMKGAVPSVWNGYVDRLRAKRTELDRRVRFAEELLRKSYELKTMSDADLRLVEMDERAWNDGWMSVDEQFADPVYTKLRKVAGHLVKGEAGERLEGYWSTAQNLIRDMRARRMPESTYLALSRANYKDLPELLDSLRT